MLLLQLHRELRRGPLREYLLLQVAAADSQAAAAAAAAGAAATASAETAAQPVDVLHLLGT